MERSVAIIGTRGYPSYYGGFETAVRYLAPYLAERGWDVTVYCRPNKTRVSEEGDPRVRRVFTKGIETRSLSSLSFSFTSIFDARRRKPDVALVMNVANGFALPLLRGKNRVPTLLNVDGIEWERDKWSKPAKAVFRLGAVLSARFADRLVFDAHEIGNYWRKEFKKDGVFIPYGGSEDFVPVPLPGNLRAREYALVVARFVPENSIKEFFEAAKTIAQNHPVVIVGSTGYGGAIDEEAETLAKTPNVYWLGHVQDDNLLHSLWASAGAYFHGHTVGGTNPALVQAMMLGAPVVARDTIFNREVLENAGVFVGSDPNSIADSVMAVLRDASLQEQLSLNARERALSVYTWDKVCSAYERELLDLAEKKD